MASSSFATRDSVEQRIIEMAQKDPQFRKELSSNPSQALSKMFGGDLPSNVNFQVHEEDPNTVHLVLPAATDAGSAASTTYCNQDGGKSWSSCGYELSCYGPTCCP